MGDWQHRSSRTRSRLGTGTITISVFDRICVADNTLLFKRSGYDGDMFVRKAF
jgi:hypothetical protein